TLAFNGIGQAVSTRSVTVKNGVTSTTEKTNIKYNSIGIETGYSYSSSDIGTGADGSAIDTSESSVYSITGFNDIWQPIYTTTTNIRNNITSVYTSDGPTMYDIHGNVIASRSTVQEFGTASDGTSINNTWIQAFATLAFNGIGQAVSTRSVTVKNGVTSTTEKTNIKYNSIGIETGYNYSSSDIGTGADGSALDSIETGTYSVISFNAIWQPILTTRTMATRLITKTETDLGPKMYNLDGTLHAYDIAVTETSPDRTVNYEDSVIILRYNDAGEVARQKEVITESTGDIIIKEDIADTTYDLQGRFIGSDKSIEEIKPGLDYSYNQNITVQAYNDIGQIARMTRVTADGISTDTQTDIESKKYDTTGRLVYSAVTVNKTASALDSTTTVYTTIDSYDSSDRVARQTVATVEDGKTTTETTYADNVYDSEDRLTWSGVTVHETGNGLDHTYIVDTQILGYNAADQITRMLRNTVDGNTITTNADSADRIYDTNGRLTQSETLVVTSGGSLDATIAYVVRQYNAFGQVIAESWIKSEGDKVITEVDYAQRTYDTSGRLTWSGVLVTETEENYSKTYAVDTTIYEYNSLGQVAKMAQITDDGMTTTVQIDQEARTYDALGRLNYSDIIITETGTGLNRVYEVETTISKYNDLNQVLLMTTVTTEDDKVTTQTDLADRTYDSLGRLTSSNYKINASGGALDYTYTVATVISSYNSIGQVLQMTITTVDGGKTTVETDASDRTYDELGRLLTSNVSITESGTGLDHTYAVKTIINSYNDAGQIAIMTRTTIDGDVTTTATDTADRYYDSSGRLAYSQEDVLKTGTDLNQQYSMTTTINAYNSLGQVLFETQVVKEGDKITIIQDTADRTYNALGQLTYSVVCVSERGGNLEHDYYVETAIDSYNDLDQVLTQTVRTMDGGYLTKQTDTASRTYDKSDRLVHSSQEVVLISTEGYTTSTSYTMDTTVDKYNSLGQVLRETVVVVQNGVTTTQYDNIDRTYDSSSRLTHSNITYNSVGTNLSRSYVIDTLIGSYNSLSQPLSVTEATTEGANTTTETTGRTYDTSGNYIDPDSTDEVDTTVDEAVDYDTLLKEYCGYWGDDGAWNEPTVTPFSRFGIDDPATDDTEASGTTELPDFSILDNAIEATGGSSGTSNRRNAYTEWDAFMDYYAEKIRVEQMAAIVEYLTNPYANAFHGPSSKSKEEIDFNTRRQASAQQGPPLDHSWLNFALESVRNAGTVSESVWSANYTGISTEPSIANYMAIAEAASVSSGSTATESLYAESPSWFDYAYYATTLSALSGEASTGTGTSINDASLATIGTKISSVSSTSPYSPSYNPFATGTTTELKADNYWTKDAATKAAIQKIIWDNYKQIVPDTPPVVVAAAKITNNPNYQTYEWMSSNNDIVQGVLKAVANGTMLTSDAKEIIEKTLNRMIETKTSGRLMQAADTLKEFYNQADSSKTTNATIQGWFDAKIEAAKAAKEQLEAEDAISDEEYDELIEEAMFEAEDASAGASASITLTTDNAEEVEETAAAIEKYWSDGFTELFGKEAFTATVAMDLALDSVVSSSANLDDLSATNDIVGTLWSGISDDLSVDESIAALTTDSYSWDLDSIASDAISYGSIGGITDYAGLDDSLTNLTTSIQSLDTEYQDVFSYTTSYMSDLLDYNDISYSDLSGMTDFTGLSGLLDTGISDYSDVWNSGLEYYSGLWTSGLEDYSGLSGISLNDYSGLYDASLGYSANLWDTDLVDYSALLYSSTTGTGDWVSDLWGDSSIWSDSSLDFSAGDLGLSTTSSWISDLWGDSSIWSDSTSIFGAGDYTTTFSDSYYSPFGSYSNQFPTDAGGTWSGWSWGIDDTYIQPITNVYGGSLFDSPASGGWGDISGLAAGDTGAVDFTDRSWGFYEGSGYGNYDTEGSYNAYTITYSEAYQAMTELAANWGTDIDTLLASSETFESYLTNNKTWMSDEDILARGFEGTSSLYHIGDQAGIVWELEDTVDSTYLNCLGFAILTQAYEVARGSAQSAVVTLSAEEGSEKGHAITVVADSSGLDYWSNGKLYEMNASSLGEINYIGFVLGITPTSSLTGIYLLGESDYYGGYSSYSDYSYSSSYSDFSDYSSYSSYPIYSDYSYSNYSAFSDYGYSGSIYDFSSSYGGYTSYDYSYGLDYSYDNYSSWYSAGSLDSYGTYDITDLTGYGLYSASVSDVFDSGTFGYDLLSSDTSFSTATLFDWTDLGDGMFDSMTDLNALSNDTSLGTATLFDWTTPGYDVNILNNLLTSSPDLDTTWFNAGLFNGSGSAGIELAADNVKDMAKQDATMPKHIEMPETAYLGQVLPKTDMSKAQIDGMALAETKAMENELPEIALPETGLPENELTVRELPDKFSPEVTDSPSDTLYGSNDAYNSPIIDVPTLNVNDENAGPFGKWGDGIMNGDVTVGDFIIGMGKTLTVSATVKIFPASWSETPVNGITIHGGADGKITKADIMQENKAMVDPNDLSKTIYPSAPFKHDVLLPGQSMKVDLASPLNDGHRITEVALSADGSHFSYKLSGEVVRLDPTQFNSGQITGAQSYGQSMTAQTSNGIPGWNVWQIRVGQDGQRQLVIMSEQIDVTPCGNYRPMSSDPAYNMGLVGYSPQVTSQLFSQNSQGSVRLFDGTVAAVQNITQAGNVATALSVAGDVQQIGRFDFSGPDVQTGIQNALSKAVTAGNITALAGIGATINEGMRIDTLVSRNGGTYNSGYHPWAEAFGNDGIAIHIQPVFSSGYQPAINISTGVANAGKFVGTGGMMDLTVASHGTFVQNYTMSSVDTAISSEKITIVSAQVNIHNDFTFDVLQGIGHVVKGDTLHNTIWAMNATPGTSAAHSDISFKTIIGYDTHGVYITDSYFKMENNKIVGTPGQTFTLDNSFKTTNETVSLKWGAGTINIAAGGSSVTFTQPDTGVERYSAVTVDNNQSIIALPTLKVNMAGQSASFTLGEQLSSAGKQVYDVVYNVDANRYAPRFLEVIGGTAVLTANMESYGAKVHEAVKGGVLEYTMTGETYPGANGDRFTIAVKLPGTLTLEAGFKYAKQDIAAVLTAETVIDISYNPLAKLITTISSVNLRVGAASYTQPAGVLIGINLAGEIATVSSLSSILGFSANKSGDILSTRFVASADGQQLLVFKGNELRGIVNSADNTAYVTVNGTLEAVRCFIPAIEDVTGGLKPVSGFDRVIHQPVAVLTDLQGNSLKSEIRAVADSLLNLAGLSEKYIATITLNGKTIEAIALLSSDKTQLLGAINYDDMVAYVPVNGVLEAVKYTIPSATQMFLPTDANTGKLITEVEKLRLQPAAVFTDLQGNSLKAEVQSAASKLLSPIFGEKFIATITLNGQTIEALAVVSTSATHTWLFAAIDPSSGKAWSVLNGELVENGKYFDNNKTYTANPGARDKIAAYFDNIIGDRKPGVINPPTSENISNLAEIKALRQQFEGNMLSVNELISAAAKLGQVFVMEGSGTAAKVSATCNPASDLTKLCDYSNNIKDYLGLTGNESQAREQLAGMLRDNESYYNSKWAEMDMSKETRQAGLTSTREALSLLSSGASLGDVLKISGNTLYKTTDAPIAGAMGMTVNPVTTIDVRQALGIGAGLYSLEAQEIAEGYEAMMAAGNLDKAIAILQSPQCEAYHITAVTFSQAEGAAAAQRLFTNYTGQDRIPTITEYASLIISNPTRPDGFGGQIDFATLARAAGGNVIAREIGIMNLYNIPMYPFFSGLVGTPLEKATDAEVRWGAVKGGLAGGAIASATLLTGGASSPVLAAIGNSMAVAGYTGLAYGGVTAASYGLNAWVTGRDLYDQRMPASFAGMLGGAAGSIGVGYGLSLATAGAAGLTNLSGYAANALWRAGYSATQAVNITQG
ncbi:MAG: hypothetical protein PHS46_07815, partial [Candidatus Omnitrophica bacterium]|nr:hypothetical protein [Candidatus Omnitrophota bacterium]